AQFLAATVAGKYESSCPIANYRVKVMSQALSQSSELKPLDQGCKTKAVKVNRVIDESMSLVCQHPA
ncbi:MAG: hypothetical protein ACK5M8_02065, partial [Shewanella algae]